MDWQRVLLIVGICVIVSSYLEEGVEALNVRIGRRRSSGKRDSWIEKNEIRPLQNSQRREEMLKVTSGSKLKKYIFGKRQDIFQVMPPKVNRNVSKL